VTEKGNRSDAKKWSPFVAPERKERDAPSDDEEEDVDEAEKVKVRFGVCVCVCVCFRSAMSKSIFSCYVHVSLLNQYDYFNLKKSCLYNAAFIVAVCY
jgi:hypothetical protein